MSNKPLSQWLEYLETLHPREMELGLERVRRVAENLDLLPLSQQVITVAGTNGKGSTVAVLEALLGEAGLVVGSFTSPHLLRFNERIRVGGEEAPDEQIVAAFEAIEAARGQTSLTYFEFATLAALLVFREQEPAIVVLEVGLGGRLDSVNIVDPTIAVITAIDLDHQDWLGDDRGLIAREKAGILRGGTPAVIADPDPPPELGQAAVAAGAQPVLFLGRDFGYVSGEDGALAVELVDDRGCQHSLSLVYRGSLLPENISAALQAAALAGLEFTREQVDAALRVARPQGRRELQELAGIQYLLDVAHNPAAVNKMLEYIDSTPCKGRTICVFSVMSDKDVEAMVAAAAGHFEGWFLGELPGVNRAASAAEVAAILHRAGQGMTSVSKNVRQAFRRAQSLLREGDRLVVFGSFHTVAAVLPLLEKDRRKHS